MMVIKREDDRLKKHKRDRTYGEGPCMANSISWILGVPREAVPNFTLHEDFGESVDCYLYSWGLQIQEYDPIKHKNKVDYVLHTGVNESGVEHIVVCDIDGNLLYDSFSIGGSLVKDIYKWVIVPYNVGDVNDE